MEELTALQAVKARKSTRAYKSQPVPADTLAKIVEAASCAPVAMGKYDSLHLSVIQDGALLKDIAAGASAMASRALGVEKNMDFGAPAMVVISSVPAMMPGHENLNAGCVAENMAIAATGLGVDNLVWGAAAAAISQDATLVERAGIPEGFKPILAVSLGYAAKDEAPKQHAIETNWV